MNYINFIAKGEMNEEVHNALTRYGPGDFTKEELIISISKNKIKIQGGLDMVNPIQRFVASVCRSEVTYKGAIPTTRDVGSELDELGVGYEEARRFGKKGKKYEINATLSPDKALQLVNQLYSFFLLVDLKSEDCKTKVKKKDTPKIGSLSPKFVTGEIPADNLEKVKEVFLFDADFDKAKKVVVTHTFVVSDIILDEELLKQDALAARLQAKRKGTLKRKIDVDGTVAEKEYSFEA
jgi:hypothetical protein